ISSSINETGTFYVRKIDDLTIKLFDNLADAQAPDQTVTPSSGVSNDRITVSGAGYGDGTAVTYHTDPPAGFSSGSVDVTVGPDNRIGGDADNDRIYLGTNPSGDGVTIEPQHFVNGEKVIYHVEPGKSAIAGLTDGGVYYITNADTYTVQLADNPTDAANGVARHLNPDKSDAAKEVRHFLTAAPIGGPTGGLTDGNTYWVRNSSGNSF